MVRIDGRDYEPRALTVREVRSLKGMDETDADIRAIHLACGLPESEVGAWMDKVSMGTVIAVTTEVFRVTGIDEGAQFPPRQGHDAGAERSGD